MAVQRQYKMLGEVAAIVVLIASIVWTVYWPQPTLPRGRGRDGAPLDGEPIFRGYCAPCHQVEGVGTQGSIPPLADSPWLDGPAERLIRVVLHGLRGPVRVGDDTFNLEMPGFGAILDDQRIAAVLSFVRLRFGASGKAVEADLVRRVRQETEGRSSYWTEPELLEVR